MSRRGHIEKFLKKKIELLEKEDLEVLREFYKSRKITYHTDEQLKRNMYECIYHDRGYSEEQKKRAEMWLIYKGYMSPPTRKV